MVYSDRSFKAKSKNNLSSVELKQWLEDTVTILQPTIKPWIEAPASICTTDLDPPACIRTWMYAGPSFYQNMSKLSIFGILNSVKFIFKSYDVLHFAAFSGWFAAAILRQANDVILCCFPGFHLYPRAVSRTRVYSRFYGNTTRWCVGPVLRNDENN